MPMSFEWPVDDACFPQLDPMPDTPTPEQLAAREAVLLSRWENKSLAVAVLFNLSGRQYGIETVTARPCPPQPPAVTVRGQVHPLIFLDGGTWFTETCGCWGRCRHTGPRALHLPGPVQAVTEVTIGGVLLNPGGYVLEGDILYRKTGPWPSQDLGRPAGEPGTWTVKYERGVAVPSYAAQLAGVLAKEFLAACDGTTCRLPRNVTAVTRQGVSYRVYDPATLPKGRTGLSEVDLWLSSVNPNALQQNATVI